MRREASRQPAPYCPVTVLHGRTRLDAALPADVPIAELLPALLRVLLPHNDAQVDGAENAGWTLVPLARPAIASTQTLDEAGVLAGDLLTELPGLLDESAPPTSHD
jgi:hypothetical protein